MLTLGDLQTDIPRLSRVLPPAETLAEGTLEPTSEILEQFIDNLRESVRLRVENIPPSNDPRCVQFRIEIVFTSYLKSRRSFSSALVDWRCCFLAESTALSSHTSYRRELNVACVGLRHLLTLYERVGPITTAFYHPTNPLIS